MNQGEDEVSSDENQAEQLVPGPPPLEIDPNSFQKHPV